MSGCCCGQAGSQFCDICSHYDECFRHETYPSEPPKPRKLTRKEKSTLKRNKKILNKLKDPNISNKEAIQLLSKVKVI